MLVDIRPDNLYPLSHDKKCLESVAELVLRRNLW